MAAITRPPRSFVSSKHAAEKKTRNQLEAEVKEAFLKPRVTDHQDLPPISSIRDALVRSAVGKRTSSGISYSLPANKSRLSIENVYQTDLRCLFQQPYLECNYTTCDGFDDVHHLQLDRCHLKPNSLQTLDRKHVQTLLGQHQHNRVCLHELANSFQVDVRSRVAIRSCLHSAPADSFIFNEPRCRSRFSLPISLKPTEASCEARQLAHNILKSLNLDGNVSEDAVEATKVAVASGSNKSIFNLPPSEGTPCRVNKKARATLPLREAHLQSFEQFQESIPDRCRPSLPADMETDSKLTFAQKQHVWQWLTESDELDKFNYFLSLCR